MKKRLKQILSVLLAVLILFSVVPISVFAQENDITFISTSEDFYNIRNNLNGSYVLLNDIDLSGYENWEPIGTSESSAFIGIIDGNGHTIKGVKIYNDNVSTDKYIGVFGYNAGAINNLNVEIDIYYDFYGDLRVYCGGIAGYNFGRINNCKVNVEMQINRCNGKKLFVRCGGITGDNNCGVINNCVVDGNIAVSGISWQSDWIEIGGVVGLNTGKILNCTNNSKCYESCGSFITSSLGGIVGRSEGGTVSNVCNNGNVILGVPNGTTNYVGGIVGSCYNTIIKNSYNNGKLVDDNCWGVRNYAGISGNCSLSEIINCYNIGYLPSKEDCASGTTTCLIATGDVTIVDCYYLQGDVKDSNATALTESEFSDKDNFVGWDFENVWEIKSGFPVLRECKEDISLFKAYSNSATNCLTVGSIDDLIIGYYNSDGSLNEEYKNFICVVSDSNIISVSEGEWNSEKGREYYITAKNPGYAAIALTNPDTGEVTAYEYQVVNSEAGYRFDNIPKLSIEEGKTTNFYNYSGLVVDEFSYEPHTSDNGNVDYYVVTMNVYNSRNLYAVVTSYNEKGDLYSYYIVDKKDDYETSFTESVEELYYLVKDTASYIGNSMFYSGKSVTKPTEVTIKVPVNGYLSISNNIASSEMCLLVNSISSIIDLCKNFKDFVDSTDSFSDSLDKTIIEMTCGELIEKNLTKTVKKVAVEELNSGDFNYKNLNEFISRFNDRMVEFGINIAEEVEKNFCTATGIAKLSESAITKILPTGWLIEILYQGNDSLNYCSFMDEFNRSASNPQGIYLYTPYNPSGELSYKSNGTTIISEDENSIANTVIHVYNVVDTKIVNINNTSWKNGESYKHYVYTPYSITMYRNGVETQPGSTVEVRIPIPEGYHEDYIKVYHYDENGNLIDMNAHVENGYIIFTTNHFSYYVVSDEYIEHFDDNHNGICDACNSDLTANCTHFCHSGNKYIQLIWKIIRLIYRIFGMENKLICDCGKAHW